MGGYIRRTAARGDWNPSAAKWSGQLWRVERYRAGRADGTSWPALNSAKRVFDGSLTTAIVAAGFAPAKPGPRRRAGVDPEQAGRAVMSPEGRAMVAAALARAREAEVRAERAERARQRTKVVRERVPDQRALAAAAKRLATTDGELVSARADATEARTAAKRLAARLERSEATVGTLRDERRQLKAARDSLGDRVAALERLLEVARRGERRAAILPPTGTPERAAVTGAPQAARRAPERAAASRGADEAALRAPERAAASRGADEAALGAAKAELRAARRQAEQAELRAARFERELKETVAAVRGEQRRLTPAELAELRAKGPTGPGVLAAALKQLAAARGDRDRPALKVALGEIARAAITWQERA